MRKGLAWGVGRVYSFLIGTGPLAFLSLFPVADLDKVSNDIFWRKLVAM